MMVEEKQKLSVDEQGSIAQAVLQLVKSYPDFPKTITAKKILMDDIKGSEDIGIFPTSGAVVLKKYVSGSFEAQFPFVIDYKCAPTANDAFIKKRSILDNLAKWLENAEYPALSDGRRIQSIERTTTTASAGKTPDGNSVFRCGFTLKYFKKRS